jgi:hypothetical protein
MLRKNIRTLLSLILLVAPAMPLLAEWTVDQQMRVAVPFAFSANDKVMPAGEYTVSIHPENGTILMQAKGQSPLIFTTIPKETHNIFDRGRLVFRKSGTSMSLSEIYTRGNVTGRALPYSDSAEKSESTHNKHLKQTLVVAIP